MGSGWFHNARLGGKKGITQIVRKESLMKEWENGNVWVQNKTNQCVILVDEDRRLAVGLDSLENITIEKDTY